MSPLRPFTTRRRHLRPEFAGVPALPVLVGAGDPGSSRLVYAMVIGLVLVGIAFVVLAVWLIRQTRYDLPVLAPLERMGDRDWRRQSDPATQRRILDEVRPEGAEPLRSESSPPSLDAEFELAERPVTSMSDLAPPVAEARSATPHGLDRPDMLDFEPEAEPEPEPKTEPEPEPEPGDAADGEVDEPAEGPVTESEETPDLDEPENADDLVEAHDETSMPGAEESAEDAPEDPSAQEPDDATDGTPQERGDEPVDGAVHGSTDTAER